MKKQIKKYNAQDLRERIQKRKVTLAFEEKVWLEFQKIMKEQKLTPSGVLNQFMKLANELLKEGSGEVCFIFEESKTLGLVFPKIKLL